MPFDKRKFFRFWFPVVLYSGIIFYVSSLPDTKIPVVIPYLDKVIHVLEYAFLGFLFSRAVASTTHLETGSSGQQILFFTALFCLCYGLSDEYHQSFVAGRVACLNDWVADGVGGFLGGLVFLKRYKIFKRIFS